MNTSDWGKIVITDNSGKSYILYAVKRELNLDDYELPPAPPSGMFDVRYGSGRYAEDLSSGSQSIEMQGIDYPIKIRVEKMDIRLSDATGKGLNQSLKSGDEVTISNSSISKLLVTVKILSLRYFLWNKIILIHLIRVRILIFQFLNKHILK